MTDQGRAPTPEEEAGRIIQLLPDVDASRTSISRAATGVLVAGSDAAQDGLARKGGLAGTFAVQQVMTALDHLLAWRALASAGHLATFAHMSLLRSALEGAVTARWLIEQKAGSPERVRRGAVAQLEDWRQRRSFETSFGVTEKTWKAAQGGKSAEQRYREHLDVMRELGMVPVPAAGEKEAPPKMPDSTWLVDRYGGGEWAYRLMSGFAHRAAWATGMLSAHQREVDAPALPGARGIEVVADWRWTLRMTALSAEVTREAVAEVEAYFGGTTAEANGTSRTGSRRTSIREDREGWRARNPR
jgi:hypothetical protein